MMGTPKKKPSLEELIQEHDSAGPPEGLRARSRPFFDGPAEPARSYEQALADYKEHPSSVPSYTEPGYIAAQKRHAIKSIDRDSEGNPRFRLPDNLGYLTENGEYSSVSPSQEAHNEMYVRAMEMLNQPRAERDSALAHLRTSKGLRANPTTPEEVLKAQQLPDYTGIFSRFKRKKTLQELWSSKNQKVEDVTPEILKEQRVGKPINYDDVQRSAIEDLESYKRELHRLEIDKRHKDLLRRKREEGPKILAADPQLRALHEHNKNSDHYYERRIRDGVQYPYNTAHPVTPGTDGSIDNQGEFNVVEDYTPQGLHRLRRTRKPIYARPPVITGDESNAVFKPSGDPIADQSAHQYVENIKRLGLNPDQLKEFERGLPPLKNITRLWNKSLGLPNETTQTARVPVPKELSHLSYFKAKQIIDKESALRERARGLPFLRKYFKGHADGDKIISSEVSELRRDVAKHKDRYFRDLGGILTGIGDEKNPLQRGYASVTGSSNRSDAFNTAVGVGAAGVGAVGGGALLLHKMRKAREAANTAPSLISKLKALRR